MQGRFMNCRFCSAEISYDSDTCAKCQGEPPWRVCACGQQNPITFIRCRSCGEAFETVTAPPKLSRSERKLVTVLFADIYGSLALIHGHDPEQVSSLLEARVDLMIQGVQAFGGTVNRVMGDGIMALFGAPRAIEHHALHACLSALRMRELITRSILQDGTRAGETTGIRIGLASGEVVVKPMVANNFAGYDADGEIVHLAARMEQIAPVNTILITQRTALAVAQDITLRPYGPTRIKGLPDLMEVYEVAATRSRRPTWLNGRKRPRTTLIGRERELAAIANAREQAAAGYGRAISISGDAGCGKSRLLYEAIRRKPRNWTVLSGQSVAYDQKGYRVVLGLLADLFGLRPEDEASSALAKIQTLLTLHGQKHLLAPLAALHQLGGTDPDWRSLNAIERGRRIQDAVTQLIAAIGERQNIAILVEDSHWIDSESLMALERLAGLAGERRILLVATFRPEWQAPWVSLPHHIGVHVDRLTADESRRLLASNLESGPGVSALEETLIERTGGNPLFLEEMLAALAEQGMLLSRVGGRYRLLDNGQLGGLPDSIRGLLTERIDRLAGPDKNLLQAAAVAGLTFPVRLLNYVTGSSQTDLNAACARLFEAGFIDRLDGVEPSFTFRHILMCEAAYASLLHQRRQALHGLVADAIENVYEDRIAEHVEEIARHAAAAGRWWQAADYGARAGAKAAARDASAEAVKFYECALEHLSHCENTPGGRSRTIDLCLAIRDPLFRLGRLTEIASHLRRAEPLLGQLGDCSQLGMFHILFSHFHSLTADFEKALGSCEEALRIVGLLDDLALDARVHFQLGFVKFSRHDFIGADAALRRAWSYLAANPNETRYGLNCGFAVAALSYCARAKARIGDPRQASLDVERMLALAKSHASPFEWAFACIAAGEVNEYADLPEEAATWMRRAVDWGDQANAPLLAVTASGRLGLIETRSGHVATGVKRLRDALARTEEMGFRHQLPFGLRSLAEAMYLSGDFAAARDLAKRARALSVAIGDDSEEAEALLVLGRCLMQNGRTAAARARFRAARAAASRTQIVSLNKQCELAMATVTSTPYHERDPEPVVGKQLPAPQRIGLCS
jgi:class 3 adenylate cyclase/tetratricopeptide (TPR) repeat protein